MAFVLTASFAVLALLNKVKFPSDQRPSGTANPHKRVPTQEELDHLHQKS